MQTMYSRLKKIWGRILIVLFSCSFITGCNSVIQSNEPSKIIQERNDSSDTVKIENIPEYSDDPYVILVSAK